MQRPGLERADCFALFVIPVSRDCCVALSHNTGACLQFVVVVFPDHTHLLKDFENASPS